MSSDDDDEEAELMRELEKIKKEREEERLRKDAEERKAAEDKARAEILEGNPLMQAQAAAASSSAKMKRRWNDDVVFKNQSRNEPDVKKRFINDTIRNDFHRRFLNKYVQ
jgi:protein CWC15